MPKDFEKTRAALLCAYDLLCDVTPLRYDCGTLCGSLCCKGKDGNEEYGMWLLPTERELLENEGAYRFSTAEDGTETAVCFGHCRRFMRPFACRIYPYYAKLEKSGNGRINIRIKRDPRAALSCPLAADGTYLRPTPAFVRSAERAVRVLLRDEAMKKELFAVSDFLSEIEEMRRKIFGND